MGFNYTNLFTSDIRLGYFEVYPYILINSCNFFIPNYPYICAKKSFKFRIHSVCNVIGGFFDIHHENEEFTS